MCRKNKDPINVIFNRPGVAKLKEETKINKETKVKKETKIKETKSRRRTNQEGDKNKDFFSL